MNEFPPVKPACMGGWCTQRDRCAEHLRDDRRAVAERLCPTGLEMPTPVQRTAQHKAQLAADPRFAGWASLSQEEEGVTP